MAKRLVFLGLLSVLISNPAQALELFVKGSISRTYLSRAEWTTSASGATGVAFALFPRVRLEGRYTVALSQRNQLETAFSGEVYTLSDIRNQTTISSVGMEIDLLGQRSSFQPYIVLGLGYLEVKQTYYVSSNSNPVAEFKADDPRRGVSANAGVGIKLRIGKSLALETEAYGYAANVHEPNPLVDWDAKIGLRIFL